MKAIQHSLREKSLKTTPAIFPHISKVTRTWSTAPGKSIQDVTSIRQIFQKASCLLFTGLLKSDDSFRWKRFQERTKTKYWNQNKNRPADPSEKYQTHETKHSCFLEDSPYWDVWVTTRGPPSDRWSTRKQLWKDLRKKYKSRPLPWKIWKSAYLLLDRISILQRFTWAPQGPNETGRLREKHLGNFKKQILGGRKKRDLPGDPQVI